jgi:hypothetical protein
MTELNYDVHCHSGWAGTYTATKPVESYEIPQLNLILFLKENNT